MKFLHWRLFCINTLCLAALNCQNYFQQTPYPDSNVCTTEAKSGLSIVVRDKDTLTEITDAAVTVVYSSRPSQINTVDYQSYCSCYLTWEDPAGQATIGIQKAGYTAKSLLVQIERDNCHVKGQKIDIQLSP